MRHYEPADEKWILETADAIGDIVEKISSVFAKSAPLIDRLDALGDERFVASLLKLRSGIGRHELATFRALARILREREDAADVSPRTALAMDDATDEVRSEVRNLLSAGRRVDEDLLDALESFATFTSMTDHERSEANRARLLESMMIKAAPRAFQLIESSVDTLIHAVNQFRWDHFPRDISEEFEPAILRKEYLADYSNVMKLAKASLKLFERYFGHVESLTAGEPGSHEEALKKAGTALERFATGAFGDRGGFAFDGDPSIVLATELTDALLYLASEQSHFSNEGTQATQSQKTLSAVELCAGAGGQAIGLMSAGFKHLALYEKGYKRARTLRKNWPLWKVRRADIREVSDAELLKYHGVDLLAAGPPCEPFSQACKSAGRHHDDNLLPEMVRAVRLIQPRAFMFENVPGIAHDAHAVYLARISSDLAELGYKVDVFTLDAKEFGLPQDRRRLLIVGIRNDVEGTFIPPVLKRPIHRSVSEVLGPVVIKHETPSHLKLFVPSGSIQDRYDRWAESWRKQHAESYLPTITKTSSETRSDRLKNWLKCGFDTSSYAVEAPTLDDVSGCDFKPRFTLDAWACAQGFPRNWTFQATGVGNFEMVADAFPPVMAKAVALAIRATLTGLRTDLDAALSEALIDEERIGYRPLRSRIARSWQETEGLEKAHRILAGEREADVEPNAKRRPMLRAVVDGLLADGYAFESSLAQPERTASGRRQNRR